MRSFFFYCKKPIINFFKRLGIRQIKHNECKRSISKIHPSQRFIPFLASSVPHLNSNLLIVTKKFMRETSCSQRRSCILCLKLLKNNLPNQTCLPNTTHPNKDCFLQLNLTHWNETLTLIIFKEFRKIMLNIIEILVNIKLPFFYS